MKTCSCSCCCFLSWIHPSLVYDGAALNTSRRKELSSEGVGLQECFMDLIVPDASSHAGARQNKAAPNCTVWLQSCGSAGPWCASWVEAGIPLSVLKQCSGLQSELDLAFSSRMSMLILAFQTCLSWEIWCSAYVTRILTLQNVLESSNLFALGVPRKERDPFVPSVIQC